MKQKEVMAYSEKILSL